LTPICTKSFVSWHFGPDPTGGAYSAPPGPPAVFWGPTSKGRREEGRRGEWRGDGRGKGREFEKKKEKSAPM